jgi:hypothetical protein
MNRPARIGIHARAVAASRLPSAARRFKFGTHAPVALYARLRAALRAGAAGLTC